ncbi:hypothetical protein Scep_001409 [Stephania cephalantha]|uniref:Uncharacterized protein n=1 Tax=Stephania cephalantha TaxID=152367 RepID=A0AAP0L9A4_9MAGN
MIEREREKEREREGGEGEAAAKRGVDAVRLGGARLQRMADPKNEVADDDQQRGLESTSERSRRRRPRTTSQIRRPTSTMRAARDERLRRAVAAARPWVAQYVETTNQQARDGGTARTSGEMLWRRATRTPQTVVPGDQDAARARETTAPAGLRSSARAVMNSGGTALTRGAVNDMEQRRGGALSDRSIVDERRDFDEARRRDEFKWILKAMMVCSLLGGFGGAQLVTKEPSLSQRSPYLQSKMRLSGQDAAEPRDDQQQLDRIRPASDRMARRRGRPARFVDKASTAQQRGQHSADSGDAEVA